MTTHSLTATQAIRTFSDLLNQVRYQGKSFEIKRGREVIAKITPVTTVMGIDVSELNNFFNQLPTLDRNDAEDFNKTLKEIRSISSETDQWD